MESSAQFTVTEEKPSGVQPSPLVPLQFASALCDQEGGFTTVPGPDSDKGENAAPPTPPREGAMCLTE